MVAEVVPPMHVVGEGVGLGTRRTVDVGAAPVGSDGTHDVSFVPVCRHAVGCETGCDGGDHSVASFLIIMHVFIRQRDELNAG